MELKRHIRRICEQITDALKRVPEHVEVEIGVQWEPIPKPIVRLYAKLCLLKKKKMEMHNENRKKGNKCLHNNDTRTSERNET